MANEPAHQGEESPVRRQLRILHLEDDPSDAELIQLQLQMGGIVCSLMLVKTQAEFGSALEQTTFDLILSDSNLPTFDGWSALKMAVETCPRTPFIFLSGDTSDEVTREALARGASDYVRKGDLSRLIAVVRRACGEPTRDA